MKRFLKLISRRRSPSLHPHKQIVSTHEQERCWRSQGDDPQFRLRGGMPIPGWNTIELTMDHDEINSVVKFYFNKGQGFREEECITFPVLQGGKVKQLIYVPAFARAIRFDPLETTGKFSIEHLQFSWVPSWLAVDMLCRRLRKRHYRFHNKSRSKILKALKLESHRTGISWQKVGLHHYNETLSEYTDGQLYAKWVRDSEQKLIPNTGAAISRLTNLSNKPLISILLPTYNSSLDYLKLCISSVLKQLYPNWELCIADDASTDSKVVETLQEMASNDPRIKLVIRKENGQISEASNSALELATGENIALLDHDDLLAEHALLRIAETIDQNPKLSLIYSDEDKIDEEGNRFQPHFKPGWNPDLLFSQNYLSHLGVYRTELVREIGGFRTEVNGSQDHDLVLRCTALLEDNQIAHIPEILYHWRSSKGSTALNPIEKNYTTDAGVRALQDLSDNKETGVVIEKGCLPNTYRSRWPLPEPAAKVSLIVPTRDGYQLLKKCVDSVMQKTTYPDYEILILNNQSTCKQTLNYMHDLASRNDNIRMIDWDKPFNYSEINNYGVSQAEGELICLLNNDIEVITPGWLSEMVSHAIRPDIGCVGAMLYYPDDTIQHAGVVLGLGGVAGHSHKYFKRGSSGYFSRLKLVQSISAVTAACLVVRKNIFEEVGGLEEEHLPVAFNDVDLCLKVMEAGYRNLWTPYAELYHHESKTRGKDDSPEKRKRAAGEVRYMRKRWNELLHNDPYYNPNLTLKHENFSIKIHK